ncbi:MAG: cupin domain-containing protein [Spirochaetia bacterium]
MKKYTIQKSPFTVPTDDGKLIREHFGNASTGEDGISIARMIAPPGWSEPSQKPEFDEYTVVIRGRKKVVVDGEEIILNAGESVKVNRGALVQYANPFDGEVEYISVCVPAFSPERVNRSEE